TAIVSNIDSAVTTPKPAPKIRSANSRRVISPFTNLASRTLIVSLLFFTSPKLFSSAPPPTNSADARSSQPPTRRAPPAHRANKDGLKSLIVRPYHLAKWHTGYTGR